MKSPFDPPEYKEYRNPRFQTFMKYLAILVTFLINVAASAFVIQISNRLVSLIVMIVYFLIVRMSKQTIYYSDNKDLGPGWKSILLEDFVHAIRSSLFPWVLASWTIYLVDWLNK